MKTNLNNIEESGFKVPENYFENLEASILSHVNLKEKATDAGFTVPKDYFSKVEDTILTKVTKKEPVKIIPLINKKTIFYISSVAAAILLLFNLNIFNNKVTYDALAYDTVENYVLNEDIATEELATLFNEVDFSEEGFEAISFSDEAIQDYINDNIELNDLY